MTRPRHSARTVEQLASELVDLPSQEADRVTRAMFGAAGRSFADLERVNRIRQALGLSSINLPPIPTTGREPGKD